MPAIIKNLPRSQYLDSAGVNLSTDPVNLPPASTSLARTVSSVGALSGSPTSKTLEPGTTSIHLVAGSAYPIAWRFRQDGDSAGITTASGANPYDDKIPAGADRYLAIPTGAKSIVTDTVTTDSAILIVEY